MPPKSQRLNRASFNVYFKSGARRNTPHLTVIFKETNETKTAVVVSKKVFKKAHERNRLRRRIYACLGKLQPSGMVCIVIAKPAINKLTKKNLLENLAKEITDVFKNH